MLLVVLFLFPLGLPVFGQIGEGLAVGLNPTTSASFGNGNDCQGKSNSVWFKLGKHLNENPHRVGRLLKSEPGEIVGTKGLALVRESRERYLIRIGMCLCVGADEEQPPPSITIANPTASIAVLALLRFERDSKRFNTGMLPIRLQLDAIDDRNPGFVSGNRIFDKQSAVVEGLFFARTCGGLVGGSSVGSSSAAVWMVREIRLRVS